MSVWDDLVGQETAVEALLTAARSAHREFIQAGDTRAGAGTSAEVIARADEGAGTGTNVTASARENIARAMTHSWLIVGPPGSGRSLAGRAFAAALQCEHGVGCGDCKGCRTVMLGAHPDVTLMNTQRVTISREEVENLITVSCQAPSQGRWRVIVVEDADRMQERTTNVLLKSIEEPSPRTVWVLCAPSPQDVLPTIRSRCRTVQLCVPPAQAVAELLCRRYSIEPQLALTCATQAQSHIGSARHLAQDEGARETRSMVLSFPTRIRSVSDAVRCAAQLLEETKKRFGEEETVRAEAEKLKLAQDMGYASVDDVPRKERTQLKALENDQKRRSTRGERDIIDRALLDLMGFYRDVMLCQLDVGDVAVINEDRLSSIRQIAVESDLAVTIARIEAIQTARRRIAANVTALLALEAMMMTFRPQFEAKVNEI